MSCSARLPVYTLLISLLVPEGAMWGSFNLHGILLMMMYLFGFAAALISAALFKLFIQAKDVSFFIMELPGYKIPVFKNMLITLYQKGSAFVIGAGKIIIAVSIILWALASFGPGNSLASGADRAGGPLADRACRLQRVLLWRRVLLPGTRAGAGGGRSRGRHPVP